MANNIDYFTVRDLFDKKYSNSKRCITLWNLPTAYTQDVITNYVEVVTRKGLEGICNASLIGKGNVIVAVLDQAIRDLSSIKERPLCGQKIGFKYLGQVAGIVVLNVERMTEEKIQLYFESPKRSGGKEDTVKCVVFHNLETENVATVTIDDTEAIERILSRSNHEISSQKLVVEPYFPVFHNSLLDFLQIPRIKEEGDAKQKLTLAKAQSCHSPLLFEFKTGDERELLQCTDETNEQTSKAYLVSPLYQREIQSLTKLEIKHTVKHNTLTEENIRRCPDQRDGHPQMNLKKPIVSQKHLIQKLPDQLTKSSPIQENTESSGNKKLKIIYDNEDDHQILYQRAPPSHVISSRLAPVVEAPITITEINKTENELQQVRERKRFSTGCQWNQGVGNTEKRISKEIPNISRAKIVLLKIGHFQYKCKQKELNVDVVLAEKTNTVTLKGDSQANITQARLIMQELFHSTVKQALKIAPKERVAFLARQNIQDCLRFKAKNEKIGAVFEMNVDQMDLVCYGFSDESVKRGLELLIEFFCKEVIQLREGQLQYLQLPGWHELCTKRSSDTVTIYETDGKIVIESLHTVKEEKIRNIRRAVIEFLKSNCPKQNVTIEISGGEAEYFEKYCQTELENQLRSRQDNLHVRKIKQDHPIKIELIVEGDSSLVEEVKKAVQAIWHEKVDFKGIDHGDIWQIMRSLDGDIGKGFFRRFQNDNKCIIEVVREGEIQPPAIRVVQQTQKPQESSLTPELNGGYLKRHGDSDYSPDTEDELEVHASHASHDYAARENGKALKSRRLQEYQPEISEEEAFYRAIKKSLEDSGSVENVLIDNGQEYDVANYCTPHRDYQHGHINTNSPEAKAMYRVKHDNIESFKQESTKEITFGSTRVVLLKGLIAERKADVLVNIVDPFGEFPGQSIVAKGFANRGGKAVIAQYFMLKKSGNASQGHQYITVSDVVGNLTCKVIFHVELDKNLQVEEIIPEVMREVYKECTRRRCRSVCFPPLGVGRLYRYPAPELAHAMLTETERMSTPLLQEVCFVIFPEDPKTYDIFDKAFDQHKRLGHDGSMHARSISQPNFHTSIRNTTGNQSYISSQIPTANYLKPITEREQTYYKNAQQRQVQQQRWYASRSQGESFLTERKLYQPNGQKRSFDSFVDKHQCGPRRHRTRDRQRSSNNARSERFHSEDNNKKQGEGQRNRTTKSIERSYKRHDGKTEHIRSTKPWRESRFPKDVPASRLNVKVFAGGKEHCERFRNDLVKKIRDDFLFEKRIQKVNDVKVSEGAKRKIVKILEEQKVKSIKYNGGYTLMGYKEHVIKANEDILKVLLNDKTTEVPTNKRKRSRAKRATAEHARFMAVEEAGVPDYWKNYQAGEIVKNLLLDIKQFVKKQNFEKVVLDENGHTFKTILKLINSTFRTDSNKIGQGKDAKDIQPYSKFFVLKICRVENLELYGEYVAKRSRLFGKLCKKKSGYFKKLQAIEGVGKCEPCKTSCLDRDRDLDSDIYEEVNECFFFHGTQPENVDSICSEGPDYRLCSPDAMFGQGIYGAESVVKADQYTDDRSSRTMGLGHPKKMFLMRMLLGDIYVCKDDNPHKFKRAPCTTCHRDNCKEARHDSKFDSVVGNIEKKLFREFVVYESRQCYPEYLITYERR